MGASQTPGVLVTCLLVLASLSPAADGAAQVAMGFKTAITLFQHTMDVADLAMQVEGLFSGGGDDGVSAEEIAEKMGALIAASTTEIINTVLLEAKLGDLTEAVKVIHDSLVNIKLIVNAKDSKTQNDYRDIFVTSFEQSSANKHIRFLPQALTHSIPSVGTDLLTEVTRKTRCNMTALVDFGQYYLQLVSNGILIQVLYFDFKKGIKPEQTLRDEWREPVASIQSAFDRMVVMCDEQFAELAQADVDSAADISHLMMALKLRYLRKWSDVIFYADMGTEQFHYMKFRKDRLFRHLNNDNNKVAVFGDRGANTLVRWDAGNIETQLESKTFDKPDETDETAAKLVSDQVESAVTAMGYEIGAIIVFFDGEDHESTGIRVDKGTVLVQPI